MKSIISALTAIICIFTGTGFCVNSSSEKVTPDTASFSNEAAVCESSSAETVSCTAKETSASGNAETEYFTSDEKTTESSAAVSDGIYSDESTSVTESQYETPAETTVTYDTDSDIFTSADDNDTYDEFAQYEPEEYDNPEYYEYQVLYKELLNELRYDTEGIRSVEYFLFDMNEDNTPELITVTGTCEADKTTAFYTIKNHETVVIGENFRGDHSTFCIDKRTGLFVMKNEWGGLGSVTGYVFDGEKVYESTILKDYNYMHNPDGYDFVVGELYDIYTPAYGVAYSEGDSILYTEDFSEVELNADSYYFTD